MKSPFLAFIAAGLCWLLSPAIAMAEEDKLQFKCPSMHDGSKPLEIAQMTQARDGWFFRTGTDLKEHFGLLPNTKAYLKRLNEAFAKSGSSLVTLAVPPRGFVAEGKLALSQPYQKDYDLAEAWKAYERQLAGISETGVMVVRLLDDVKKKDAASEQNFFFKRDFHWTPYGAELAATALANAIKTNAKFPKNGLKKYNTTLMFNSTYKNNMGDELQRLCKDTILGEPVPIYSTSLENKGTADDLFGDANDAAPLVLLGSSFSATETFHFEGLLAQHTGLDIANFAITGGELFNSIVSYVSLPLKKRLRPDFVVWETLAHYDMNEGERMFRQIIPAVGGECSAEKAIAKTSYNTQSGNDGMLLKLPDSLDIHGHEYYIFIESDNLAFHQFVLDMDYADGDGEWFSVDRSEHFDNTGRFFIELSDELKASLKQVKITGMPDIKANLSVRLCKQS